jgi:hypothetical protein
LIVGVFNGSPAGKPIIKSSKPSPLTSPAEETDRPLRSSAFAPLITKPPTPTPDTESIFDSAIWAGKEKAGKSYVVFGKKSGAAIDLSAIDPVSGVGVGGFVINGENAILDKSIVTPFVLPNTTKDLLVCPELTDFKEEPIIKSSKPSPFTSPAEETE